jgi:peptidoglycan/xylan/chitin deacetylase (PgdA/CDA1 family)
MNRVIRKIARNTVLPLAYYAEAGPILARNSPFRRMILCYHGVNRDGNTRYNGRHISEKVFDQHLSYFSKKFEVVSLDEIFRMKRENHQPARKTIAITFDDGYENNYSSAFPLLKKHNLPATFFVSSFCLSDPEAILWADLVDILREEVPDIEIRHGGYIFRRQGRYHLVDAGKKRILIEYVKGMNKRERDAFLAYLYSAFPVEKILKSADPSSYRLMSRSQVAEIAASGLVEIGSHSHSHFNLANIPAAEAKAEIETSQKLLAETCGTLIRSIAYPDGNYNEEVKEISRTSGFRNLLAVSYQCPDDAADMSVLRRSGVSGTTNFYSQMLRVFSQFKTAGF